MASLSRRLPPLPTVKDILRMYNIGAKAKLSQNFIMEPRLLDRIARTAGNLEGRQVVEVGPGPGGITRAILGQGASRCIVIEKDPRFVPALRLLNEASGGRVETVLGDVLDFNMAELLPDEHRQSWDTVNTEVRVIGNLPFNVSTPLLIQWIEAMANKTNIFSYGRVPLTLTFQHEVAHRIIAAPGDKERSRLSVMCQNWANVNYRFVIPGEAFVPRPDVNVGVVSLTPLPRPYIDLPFKLVDKVVTTIFHGKKKHVLNTLKNLYPPRLASELADKTLKLANVRPDSMAIHLRMSDLDKLCHAYKFLCDVNKGLEGYNFRGCKKELSHESQKGELPGWQDDESHLLEEGENESFEEVQE